MIINLPVLFDVSDSLFFILVNHCFLISLFFNLSDPILFLRYELVLQRLVAHSDPPLPLVVHATKELQVGPLGHHSLDDLIELEGLLGGLAHGVCVDHVGPWSGHLVPVAAVDFLLAHELEAHLERVREVVAASLQ